MKFKTFLTTAILGSSMLMNAQNMVWNQFRGPERAGAVANATLAGDWNSKAPQLLWKVPIGEGFTEVLVSGKQVFTMSSTRIDSTKGWEYMEAFDEATGKSLWKTTVDSIFIDVDGFGNGPRSTPALGEKYLYCLSGFGKLLALDITNGKIGWQRDLKNEYNGTTPRWAYTSSPVLFGGNLVIEVGGAENKAFVAFDTQTGKELWACGKGVSTYSSPTVATINGQELLVFANDMSLIAINKEGKEVWNHTMPIRMPTAMPLFLPPNRFFESTVSNVGGFIVEVDANNAVKEVLQTAAVKNNWSSSCYTNDYIYGYNNAALTCMSATDGTAKWTKRGLGKGSLIRVGNYLLALSDQGVLKLIEATPKAYKELGSLQALDGKSWTAPAFANGKVYLRNLTEMAVYKLP